MDDNEIGLALEALTKASIGGWGQLPERMRALYVTSPQRCGGWLADAVASDSASKVLLEEVIGAASGIERLRDERFDIVLASHDPPHLDALEFVQAARAGGTEEPLLVLGNDQDEDLAALCFEVGADEYLPIHTTATRTLIWRMGRALDRHRLVIENRQLTENQQHRLRVEARETDHLLDQQRGLIRDLEALSAGGDELLDNSADADDAAVHPRLAEPSQAALSQLPARLIEHYRDLLRAHVMMGSGNLADEMARLAELLTAANISAQQALQLHLHALEGLLRGLGGRSTRHVLTRADLAILEIVIHLADGYRSRYRDRAAPATQQLLPGFDRASQGQAAQ